MSSEEGNDIQAASENVGTDSKSKVQDDKQASKASPTNDEDEEAEDEGSEDEDAEEGEGDDSDDEDEVEEPPPKKAKSSAKPAPSQKKKSAAAASAPKSSNPKNDEEEDSDAEIVKGLSGDDVDQSNIISGGRRSRRGRGGGTSAPKYQTKVAVDSDEDDW